MPYFGQSGNHITLDYVIKTDYFGTCIVNIELLKVEAYGDFRS